jgi:hypothetical protein
MMLFWLKLIVILAALYFFAGMAADHLASLIISRAPFTPAELATLSTTANRLRFATSVSP